MNNTTVITGNAIEIYRMRTILAALRLECRGMRKKGQSAFSIAKREFGLSGNLQSVYQQFQAIYTDKSNAYLSTLGAVSIPVS